MRIAYVCADPTVPVFGWKGCSVHVQEFIRALLMVGGEVTLFASQMGGEQPSALDSLKVRTLPSSVCAMNEALPRLLKENGPFDLIYERYSLGSWTAMEYARDSGVPGFLEVNSPLLEEATDFSEVELVHIARATERVLGTAKILIAVSSGIAFYLESRPEARGRVQVVPNGVNPSRFPRGLSPSCPAATGVFTVGLLGNLNPRNGLSTLVRAFGIVHYRDCRSRLLIVGDGPARSSLIDHLSASGLTEAAHLTGAVSPERVPALLASMDVAVAPYPNQTSYDSPLKLFEYMAAGLPVVASRVGQLAELIHDDVNGLLVQPGDALSLAGTIERLMKDPALRNRLGQAARVKALRDHSWNTIVRRILQLAGIAIAELTIGESRLVN